MIPESLQVPVLIATIFILALLIIIPLIVMTDWKDLLSSSTTMQDTALTASCALPPTLNISDNGEVISPGVLPGLDSVSESATRPLETATFAMG